MKICSFFIFLPHLKFVFRYLFSTIISLLVSCSLSSGFFWRLSSSLHYTVLHRCFLGSFLGVALVMCSSSFTGVILVFLMLLFDYSLASVFSFSVLITVPSSLHYLLGVWQWQWQWQQQRKNRQQVYLPLYGIPCVMVLMFIPLLLRT